MKLHPDLREFIKLLNAHGVEYVMVGGHAVGLYGYPRFTGDADFFVRASEENATRIVSALNQFGFGDAGITKSNFITPGRILMMGIPPNRIDVLTQISGVTFDEAWQGRRVIKTDDVEITLIGHKELLQNKAAAGRAKDLADLEELRRVDRAAKNYQK